MVPKKVKSLKVNSDIQELLEDDTKETNNDIYVETVGLPLAEEMQKEVLKKTAEPGLIQSFLFKKDTARTKKEENKISRNQKSLKRVCSRIFTQVIKEDKQTTPKRPTSSIGVSKVKMLRALANRGANNDKPDKVDTSLSGAST